MGARVGARARGRIVAGAGFACLLTMLCRFVAASTMDDGGLADAAARGDREAVRSLIKNKADVNRAQPDGTTALSWAVHRDDLDMTDWLIAAGANVNAANDYGITPLAL